MINIREIKLSTQYGNDFIAGQIIIDDTTEDISVYSMELFRSPNTDSGFISLGLVDDFSFKDYGVNLRTIAIEYFYKVKITDKSSGKTYESNVFSVKSKEPDDQAFYLNEIYRMHLDVVIDNRKLFLLSKKHEGQVCPTCYDPVRNRSQSAECPDCFNTKYVGGYYKPQVIDAVFANAPGHMEGFDISDVGEKKSPIMLWTANYPLVRIGDILVDHFNNRYVVTSWQPSYKTNYLIRQTLQVSMVQKNNIIYDVPVDTSLLER